MNTRHASIIAIAGRLLLASLFLISGLSKLAAPAATLAYIHAAGLPLPQLAYAVAIVVELGFGLTLVAGYRTRLVAAVMAVFTLATAFAFHMHVGNPDQTIHFLKNLSITGGLLQLVAHGPGSFSVDTLCGRTVRHA